LASSSTPDCAKLLWDGRTPDQNFDKPDELLYYRVEKFDELGRVSPFDIRCPDTSVNWQRYSNPEHVFCARFPKYIGHKVAQITVRDAQQTVVHPDDGRRFDFKVEHDPVKPPIEPDENYAHCEIHGFHNQQRWTKKNLPGRIDKMFRQILADLMRPVL
jgi:hypothetical protein